MKETKVEPVEKKWMSNSEAQAYLGVSAGFLQNQRQAGRLRHYKVGSVIFYRVKDLDSLIERNRII